MGLKSSNWSCLKAWFKGYTLYFTTFLVRPSTEAQQSHERASKKRSNDLERSTFRQQVQSFVCVPPWRRVTFKFWDMLKNASEVTVVPKIFFFLKILNFVQSFVECKVSLADGNLKWSQLTVDGNAFQLDRKEFLKSDTAVDSNFYFLFFWSILHSWHS
jgi:hypothetical protein